MGGGVDRVRGFDGNLGRGRGSYVDSRLHPERHVDPDLTDIGTSPIKTEDVVMTDAKKNAKKRISFIEEHHRGTLAITGPLAHDGTLVVA
jgi:hypothetical protein